MLLMKKVVAEFIGTFWLVLGGCGSAVLAAGFMTSPPNSIHMGIGFLGVAFAFGLTLLTMVYTIGPISGCHINPAVSFGLWAGNRLPVQELFPYIIAQVAGAIFASFILYVIASGKPGFDLVASGFAHQRANADGGVRRPVWHRRPVASRMFHWLRSSVCPCRKLSDYCLTLTISCSANLFTQKVLPVSVAAQPQRVNSAHATVG